MARLLKFRRGHFPARCSCISCVLDYLLLGFFTTILQHSFRLLKHCPPRVRRAVVSK